MADETTNSKSTTRAPSKPKTREESSIIDRKIERRGLPSSFSSNLVHPRDSPPRHREGVASCGKSVKSIVSFFETSKSNTASAMSVDDESTKYKLTTGNASRLTSSTTTSTATSHKPLVPHQQSLANAPDVEEYSLTLLKYRQYFTDQPLARCLDKQAQTVQARGEPSAQGDQTLNNPKKRQAPSQHSETKEKSASNIINTPLLQDHPQELIHRNPQEVAAFWSYVRNYLWISDEELGGTEEPKHKDTTVPKSPLFKTYVSPDDDPLLSPSLPPLGPERHSHRADSDASQRSLNEQRRLLASTAQQISEIDAYVSRRQRNGLDSPYASPSSPMSTLPSPLASPTAATFSANLKSYSINSSEPVRCTSCSKIRADQGSSNHLKSGQSSDRPPPPRPPMKLSRGNAGRLLEPPVMGENDEMWNFF